MYDFTLGKNQIKLDIKSPEFGKELDEKSPH